MAMMKRGANKRQSFGHVKTKSGRLTDVKTTVPSIPDVFHMYRIDMDVDE